MTNKDKNAEKFKKAMDKEKRRLTVYAYPMADRFLKSRKTFWFAYLQHNNKGLCRYCGKPRKLLKNNKHVATHYIGGMTCGGSRRLDYDNASLLTISEKFDKI